MDTAGELGYRFRSERVASNVPSYKSRWRVEALRLPLRYL